MARKKRQLKRTKAKGPWKRSDKGSTYYAYIDGKKKSLRTKDYDEAHATWRKLTNGEVIADSTMKIPALIEQFLDAYREKVESGENAERTLEHYSDFLNDFAGFECDKFTVANLRVSQLKKFHVRKWIDGRFSKRKVSRKDGTERIKRYSPHTRRRALGAVVRLMSWAMDDEEHETPILDSNPLAGMKLKGETCEPREGNITDDEWNRVLDAVADDDPFKNLLIVLHETGMRPQEARKIEARHLDVTGEHAVLRIPASEAKGKKNERIIQLNDTALTIVRRLVLKYPEKPIFRNRAGNPWSKDRLAKRFAGLQKKLKMPHLCCYAIRHRFCRNCLKRKVDIGTVRFLMGHSDLTMITKVYGQMQEEGAFLNEAVKQATGELATGGLA